MTTLESVVEFIHGVSDRDLKIDKDEYTIAVKKAGEELEKEKRAKEEAAQQELADLLEMGGPTNQSTAGDEKSEISMISEKSAKKKRDKQLGSLDKVYSEMKTKNKRLKKEIADQKAQMGNLRSIFAEFQVEFKQNKKHDKTFEQLTMGDMQDIFAIQLKLMA